jgi:pimeloyl-ACP methyl ester carboxylesterase
MAVPCSPPAIILLHSSASAPQQWDLLAEQLAPRGAVHRPALIGHAGVTLPPGRLTLGDDAARVLPLIDAAPAGVHLVGHSYGAVVALKLASWRPQRIASLTVYEPVLLHWLLGDGAASRPHVGEALSLAGEIDLRIARDDLPGAAQAFVDYWSGAGAWAQMPARTRFAVAACMPTVQRQFDALLDDAPTRDELAQLHAPALVLSGSRSPRGVQRIATLVRQALPRARHEVLEGVGHMGPMTHAARVNACIGSFVQAHAPAPARTACSDALQAA